MRIVELYAENIKKVKVVHIRPDRDVMQVTGENGSGKSSLLDSILWTLSGKSSIPSQPVRKGAESGRVRLDFGEFVATRQVLPDGQTELVIENADGARYPSPQKMLDAMMGPISMDPLEFSRMAPKAQLEMLRRLVPLDVDLDAIDAAIRQAYDERTANNRRVKSLTERVATLRAGVDPAMDTSITDISALLEEMEKASGHNTDLERRRARRAQVAQEIVGDRAVAADKRQRAAELIASAEALEKQADENEQRLATAEVLADPIDVGALSDRVKTAQRENSVREAQERQRALHRQAVDELTAAALTTDKLTATIDDNTKLKQEAIARAPMPVPGLGFGDDEVMFNGLPLEQAATGDKLRVSVALTMAANPKIRVLRIKEGSLLDDHNMDMIAEMAADEHYQCWIERVQSDGRVGIHMREGEVVAVNGVSTGAPAPQEVAAD